MTRIPSTFPRNLVLGSTSTTGRLAGAFLVAATLVACGGGDDGKAAATVTSTSVSATRYAAPALLTINGANLDNISVESDGCKNITRLTTPPTVSTPTAAYYGCTVSGAFTSRFAIRSNGATVATSTPFIVPAPQVTMAVSNGGQGVNGNIVITLAGDKVPTTVDNFLYYVNSKYYDGQIFDRVVPAHLDRPQFIAQAGVYGPSTDDGILPPPKPTQPPIPLELDPTLLNKSWTVAMARSAPPDSATAEFYINLNDNTNLDGSYAVFGTLAAESVPVVQSIVDDAPSLCNDNQLAGTYDCLPIPNVVILSAVQSR